MNINRVHFAWTQRTKEISFRKTRGLELMVGLLKHQKTFETSKDLGGVRKHALHLRNFHIIAWLSRT